MNQTISITVGETKKITTLKAFDGINGTGNDISSLVTFTVASSDPSIASVRFAPVSLGTPSVWQITGVSSGTATISVTASDSGGTMTEADTFNVSTPAPGSLSVVYGDL